MRNSYRGLRSIWPIAACAAASVVTVSSVLAQPPEPGFSLVGVPPGSTSSAVTGLTSDGSMAAGGGASSFTWTKAGGRNDFGKLPGMPKVNYAMGLSDNGIVAGSMWPSGFDDTSRAYRWNGSGPLQDLGLLPGETRSFATGISGDGNVIVGHAEHGPNSKFVGQAFRWTPSGGMQGLGYLKPGGTYSQANGISRDGTTIVGISRSQSPTSEAFVWKDSIGMQSLPVLPNAPSLDSEANASNASGSVVVGTTLHADGRTHAVRWVDGFVEDLGTFGSFDWRALAVNDDGDVIGGTYSSATSTAFLWTATTGMMDLAEYLKLNGLLVPTDYRLEHVYAISGDGLTIAGDARNLLTNARQGFVATVPASSGGCYPDCDTSGSLTIDDFVCFQTLFAVGNAEADCDDDALLTIDDFVCFQTSFAVGC